MKNNKIFLISAIISIALGMLIIFGAQFLTTTYQPNYFIPKTLSDCHLLKGIVVPIDQECKEGYKESLGSADGNLCCIPDICEGTWQRVYNQSSQLFEAICV